MNKLKVGGLMLDEMKTGFKTSWNLFYPLEGEVYYRQFVFDDKLTVKDISECILLDQAFRFGHIFVYRWDGVPVGRMWYRRENVATDHGVSELSEKRIGEIVASIGQSGRSDFYIKLKE